MYFTVPLFYLRTQAAGTVSNCTHAAVYGMQIHIYLSLQLTFACPTAMVMAAAEVNPLITGTGIKSTRNPNKKVIMDHNN